jgi:hypothetical protein
MTKLIVDFRNVAKVPKTCAAEDTFSDFLSWLFAAYLLL